MSNNDCPPIAVLDGAVDALVAVSCAETAYRRALGAWHRVMHTMTSAEVNVVRAMAAQVQPLNEESHAILDALDEAVADERERCAVLAQDAGMPALARLIRVGKTP